VGLSLERRLPSNQYPRKPITTFPTPAIDRLARASCLAFWDHDSQIAGGRQVSCDGDDQMSIYSGFAIADGSMLKDAAEKLNRLHESDQA
jgi:hypothetical protein